MRQRSQRYRPVKEFLERIARRIRPDLAPCDFWSIPESGNCIERYSFWRRGSGSDQLEGVITPRRWAAGGGVW